MMRSSRPISRSDPAALVASLERRFVTAESTELVGGEEITLLRPRSADALISEVDFERDERLPYWADLWPSSLVLASRLLEETRAHGTMLELGCGLGLVTIAAMRAGWNVVATDYYEDALRFTRANGWRNLGIEPATRLVDWRDLPSDLGTFDRVVAADVLYERDYAAVVAKVLARTIAPGGDAIVADPGRVATPEFLVECGRRGLRIADRETRPFEIGVISQRIALFRIVHAVRAADFPLLPQQQQ
ncbi:MAG: methyltransferase domain-containing protein [Gemmatimonadota bacterium]|nr:methyltransferase domain-containing protein [Gemmatimonadota bacterium]